MQIVGKDSIYTVVEQMPQFPGGEVEMMKYIETNLKYPTVAQELGLQGRITIRFYTDLDGSVKDLQILRGIHL